MWWWWRGGEKETTSFPFPNIFPLFSSSFVADQMDSWSERSHSHEREREEKWKGKLTHLGIACLLCGGVRDFLFAPNIHAIPSVAKEIDGAAVNLFFSFRTPSISWLNCGNESWTMVGSWWWEERKRRYFHQDPLFSLRFRPLLGCDAVTRICPWVPTSGLFVNWTHGPRLTPQ